MAAALTAAGKITFAQFISLRWNTEQSATKTPHYAPIAYPQFNSWSSDSLLSPSFFQFCSSSLSLWVLLELQRGEIKVEPPPACATLRLPYVDHAVCPSLAPLGSSFNFTATSPITLEFINFSEQFHQTFFLKNLFSQYSLVAFMTWIAVVDF